MLANDLSPAAVEAMKRNVELNGLGPTSSNLKPTPEKVRVNEGDAWYMSTLFRLCYLLTTVIAL